MSIARIFPTTSEWHACAKDLWTMDNGIGYGQVAAKFMYLEKE